MNYDGNISVRIDSSSGPKGLTGTLIGDKVPLDVNVISGGGGGGSAITIDNQGNGYFAAEDSNFIVGDSPATLDVNATLGRNAQRGYINIYGNGDVLIEISEDGAVFGTQWTLKAGDVFNVEGFNIDSIRLTHSGTDSAYTVVLK